MGDRIGSVSLCQEGVAKKLMSRSKTRIKLQSMLERRDCVAKITALHEGLAETHESRREFRLQFGDFLIFSRGHLVLFLTLCITRRIPMLHRFRRDGLSEQRFASQQKQAE